MQVPQIPPPYRVVAFWREDPRIKKTFQQYAEVQVPRTVDAETHYDFYPLALAAQLDDLLLRWQSINTLAEAAKAKNDALLRAAETFQLALEASDNPHCEVFVAQTALNHLTTVELLFNLIYFTDSLPLFVDQPTYAKTQQTGSLYVWLDPYLAGISRRQHKPLDTDEALWPAKEEFYCYFKRKTDPTVSPQQLANLWRTQASRIVELDEECRRKLWGWLKGKNFSEEEIRALILP
jgi:hypothetical protein